MSSPEVLTALGSTLSNKYAEGYPGRRYYGGCSEVDKAETIAIERCKALFDAEHANVQPHSGASANQAVYGAFMQAGRDAPRHGAAARRPPDARHEGVLLRQVVQRRPLRRRPARPRTSTTTRSPQLAREHRPKVILAGGSAIPRLIDFEFFRNLADEVGAIFWVDAAHFIGLVAGKAIPSPVPYADVVTFTTHKVLRGPRSGALVCKAEHADGARPGRLPDDAGRPADAHHRGQGGQLQGVRDARVRRLRPPGRRQRPGSWRPRWGSTASARRPAAPTPTCRCTTSRGSASPASTPRPAPTPPGSSSTRTPSRSTRRSPTSRRASASARRARRPRGWAPRR